MSVKIPYAPRHWALATLHRSMKRFVILVIHRRGGKTTAALNQLNKDAMLNRDHRYAYVAPLRNQAKRIAWGIVKRITQNIPGITYNESELTVYYPNGSQLSLFGADNPDALRGIGLNGVVLDEYAQMSPVLFSEIITKCVADTLGYVIIIGTPKGKGHFYRVYAAAKADPEMWSSVFLTVDDSLNTESGRTIENLRNALADDKKLVASGLMTQEEFDQEWYLSWEAALKGAVYAKQIAEARRKKRVGTVPYDPSLLTFTIHDLGIGDAHAVIFAQKPSERETHIIDYYETTGAGYPEIAKVIKDRPYVYGGHFFPFDIKNREQSTGKTRLATMEKLFGRDRVFVVPKLPEVEGIDSARSMWAHLFVDEHVNEDGSGGGLFMDLIGSHVYEVDEERGVFRPKTRHDFASHCGAAFRYMSTIEDEMLSITRHVEHVKRQPPERREENVDEYKGDVTPDWAREEGLADDEGTGPTEDELAKM